ncbi:DeoR/GlpR family DNA-binding transcription regulator [Novosphingobium sp. 1949]|uniref:DeoR/GlpR family DNA-binding transcription regulator n=1 Tax=Novosphingobium organovorum TaxID=2930092 RepID=A0ABT0BBT7_9SPHN|nr:DeoR/GlpR family DNA-binding transcription regulator [Novosphingobium organovorum]MCJ2182527.1 DeoR/GlpR family DNA-binding transcription regulator [Novosphingobium organovorum]
MPHGDRGVWAEERRQKILSVLENENRVAADELAIQFDVSRETIRRDLKTLEEEGLIRRTHGGALSTQNERPFKERSSTRMPEKRALARLAARLLQPGECCFIDAGSTTSALAESLATLERISIITNSVALVMALREQGSRAEILLLGGTVAPDVPGTYGPLALEQLANLRADVAFISPVGIDPLGGVTYFDFSEAEIARAMLRNARRRVVLADSSKCHVVSRVIVSPCRDVDILVSDIADAQEFLHGGVGQVMTSAEA